MHGPAWASADQGGALGRSWTNRRSHYQKVLTGEDEALVEGGELHRCARAAAVSIEQQGTGVRVVDNAVVRIPRRRPDPKGSRAEGAKVQPGEHGIVVIGRASCR